MCVWSVCLFFWCLCCDQVCGFLALAPKFKNMLRIYELNKKVTFSKGVLISLPARERVRTHGKWK